VLCGMTNIRLVTFNCENLFVTYKSEKQNIDMDDVLKDGWLANETLFEINSPISKELTGKDRLNKYVNSKNHSK
jgi:hypothetical protein